MNEGRYGELQPKPKETICPVLSNLDLEREKTEKGFARELRETPKGGFYSKLKKIGSAFALAGLISFYPEHKALAPQPSPELKVLESISSIKKLKKNSGMYEQVLKSFQEKGGVPLSPDLPNTILRDERFSEIVDNEALKSDKPFYNKPEVILGEEFIKNNPEKAKEYLEKISTAMKSTVKIREKKYNGDFTIGSGVLVRTKKGRFIITSNHVIENSYPISISLITNETIDSHIIAQDENSDIAVLSIDEKEYKGTDALELEENPNDVRNNDTIASVGHPLGFPFAVGISKVIRFSGYGNIFYVKDKRFSASELYLERGNLGAESQIKLKGEAIPCMSGGPMIKLGGKGKPRLVGINMGIFEHIDTINDKQASNIVGVPNILKKIRELGYGREDVVADIATSKDIIKFLKEHNLYE